MRLKNSPVYRITIFMVLVAFALAAFAGCGGKKPPQEAVEPKNVRAVPVGVETIVTEVEYSSKLKPVQEVAIAPKLAGKVATVKADVGSSIEAGQVLFTLDAGDLQAQLEQQQANLDTSRTSADQALQNAQVAYNSAKESYDKNQQLYETGAISKQALDDSKQRLDNAAIAFNFAKDNYNLVYGGASSKMSPAAAGVRAASTQLQNTIVTSPITGVVSICNVDVGEIASSASPAVTVINDRTMIAEVNLPDKMIGKVKKGQKVSLKVSALGDKEVEGVMGSISPAADSKTQNYIAKIEIDNAKGELKSGMFARVILPEEKKENVLAVPNEAIKVENGVPYIYMVVNGDTIKKEAVTLGLSNDRLTEVLTNLAKEDRIITEGQIFLNDGEKVHVID